MFNLDLPAFKATKELVSLGSDVTYDTVKRWKKERKVDKQLEEAKMATYAEKIERKVNKHILDHIAAAPVHTDAQTKLIADFKEKHKLTEPTTESVE
jgi:hypothetical protein